MTLGAILFSDCSSRMSRSFAMKSVFILLALLVFWVGCASQHTYDVYPEGACPTDEGCITLADVLNEKYKYLAFDTKLILHPGDHGLYYKEFSVAYVRNLTLQGSSSSSGPPSTRILCVYSSLSFTGVSELHITSINFVSCSGELSHSSSVVFQDCSFENGTGIRGHGGAIAVLEGSNVQFVGLTVFAGNQAMKGGAIWVSDSILTFTGHTVFTDNQSERGGAVFTEYSSILEFNGNTEFEGNAAEYGGAAVYALKENILSFFGSSSFEYNRADLGGVAFTQEHNTITFQGNSEFKRNEASTRGVLYFDWSNKLFCTGNTIFEDNKGGVISTFENNWVNFDGNSDFRGNTAEDLGGVLQILESNRLSFNGNSSFNSNTAVYGGVGFIKDNNIINFNGTTSFEGNTAKIGGVLLLEDNNSLIISGRSHFRSNTAKLHGAGLLATSNNSINFTGVSSFEANCAADYGGAIFLYAYNKLSLTENVSFSDNTASFGGAIMEWLANTIEITGAVALTGNEASYGGGVCVTSGVLILQGTGSLLDNHATQLGYGGAILAIGPGVRLMFDGFFDIRDNTAGFGGGVAMFDVLLVLSSGTSLTFVGNVAHRRGGAIHVRDIPFEYCIFDVETRQTSLDRCFTQFSFEPCRTDISSPTISLNITVSGYSLTFINNTAVESGDTLYGGYLDSCIVCIGDNYIQGSDVFRQITNISIVSDFSVSSDPFKVCICENNQPNCTLRTTHVQVYPGQVLSISVVAVGQMDGAVPSVIRAVSEGLIITPDLKLTQPAGDNKQCTKLQYPLMSKETNASLELYSDEPCSTYGFPITVLITFLPCPVGFTLSDQGTCVCEERLQKYTQTCLLENLTISREHGEAFWVGVDHHSESEGLILHPHCPFDYCTDEAVDFTMNTTDLQCTNGRSGMLCGACRSGHSLALGSSRCLSDCSSHYLALLLAFAVAGIALVAFLFLCRLTVAQGALSGLIFYANVLAVNQSIFFPSGSTNILTVFIAWVNLDLGIETCFFVSLDTYSRTWLQFVFPIYIWVLVGLVIYCARISTVFAKIIGHTNPVAVLATLFLLSYTKLLRAIMVAFSFTILDYPNNESRLVWLYDGNIGYLDKHHIILFVFSLLVFLFIFLPYTLLLLCGQWILRKLQLRWLSPTKQLYLKTFLDAYYAPFTDKHHYWTGLLLSLRFVILLFATVINIGQPQDPFVSLVVLLGILSGMLLWVWLVIDKLYKKWYLYLLEASFHFNLIVLIGGTYQVRLTEGNQTALVYTSVAMAFATFTGIVISSVVYQVKRVLEQNCTAPYQINTEVDVTQNSDEVEPTDLPAGVHLMYTGVKYVH